MTAKGDMIPGNYVYSFTPCSNGLRCKNSNKKSMAIDTNMNNQYDCNQFATWDPNVVPSFFYDIQNRAAFSFNYIGPYNKTLCPDTGRISWNPIFVCNPNVEYEWGNVFEPDPCVYTVDIYTKYACIQDMSSTWSPWSTTDGPWISSTMSPFGECSFETDDGEHVLDITHVAGKTLSFQNQDNFDEYFVYTPCTNTMRCKDDTIAMAYLFDNQDFQCDRYLAVWDYQSVEPSYSPSKKIWQFVYENGQKCDGLENVFVVNWVCDKYAASPKIVEAMQSGSSCVYSMSINSSLACD